MREFTDPKDYTECCGGLGYKDGHEGLSRQPHLHADNCPLREAIEGGDSHCGSPPLLFRVDPDEEKSFARISETFGGPLAAIATSLDTWGRMHVSKDGYSGSYSQQCFVMANECMKAEQRIKDLEAKLGETHDV